MSKKKIIFYTGSRADYGILEPIIKKLKKKTDLFLVIGPHHFVKNFGYSKKHINRKMFKKTYNCESQINYRNVDINKFIKSSIPKYKKIINNVDPDLVIILGDRYEVLSFVIASFFQNKKICHLHGGEKTTGSFDDTIRHVITKFSDYHFTTNDKYKNRILSLGENKKNIFNFGSIGAENLKKLKYLSKEKILSKLGIFNKKDIILVTFHPETNSLKSYKFQIETFLSSLKKFNNYHFVFTASNGDPGGDLFNSRIKKFVRLNENSSFFYTLGTQNYLNVMKFSKMIIGNSSSAIIESPSFNIPVLNIGSRQNGREFSKNILSCEINKAIIENKIKKLSSFKKKKLKQLNLNYKKNSLLNTSNKILNLVKKQKEFKYFYDNKK